jgi:hypothetical protein
VHDVPENVVNRIHAPVLQAMRLRNKYPDMLPQLAAASDVQLTDILCAYLRYMCSNATYILEHIPTFMKDQHESTMNARKIFSRIPSKRV